MIGEDEAEASVPMHMPEVSEDTADDDLSSRYFCRSFSSFEISKINLLTDDLEFYLHAYQHITNFDGCVVNTWGCVRVCLYGVCKHTCACIYTGGEQML